MGILRRFMQHHAHPEGWMGRLVAWRLSRANRQVNEWTVSLLELTPTDHVLEIGFGPGVALQRIAALVPQGHVAGVDSSPVMQEAATKRNAAEIASGRIELRAGVITALPYPDHHFDKGLAVQVINYLPDLLTGLREWRRVMKPGGRVALFFEAPEKYARTRQLLEGIYRPYAAEEVVSLMQQVGFSRVWCETKAFFGARGICVLAEN